jgi:hypothetical protein
MDHSTRQLVVLCDGTNNNLTGGRADTNVLKLMNLLAQDEHQCVFYDPGVGNASALPGATWSDRTRRRLDRLAGLASGRGAYENIAEAYTFLMRTYRPGDEIFIFGFSRGAFTARAVAGLVNQFGILRRELENLVPTLVHVYFSDAGGNREKQEELEAVTRDIRRLCAAPGSEAHEVWFVGVWDTVSSIGIPPFTREIHKPATVSGKRMRHVRQALALDEHRRPFRPRLYAEKNFAGPGRADQSLRQEWFPGAHCDVGGGYGHREERLSDEALGWLVREAVGRNLRVKGSSHPPRKGPDGTTVRHRVVHSEMQDNPWWSAAGLCVRDGTRVRLRENWVELDPVQNAHSASQPPLQFPADTAWPKTHWGELGAALAVMVLAYVMMGAVLLGGAPGFDGVPAWLRAGVQANAQFAAWQFWPAGAAPGAWRATALVLDFLFIGAYSYVAGWLFGAGFAAVAGLRKAGSPAKPVLNFLGLGLMVLVIADVSENLLSLLVLAGQGWWYAWLDFVARVALGAASWAKWLAAAWTVPLLVCGVFARIKFSLGGGSASAPLEPPAAPEA